MLDESYRNLLLDALAVCRPMDEDREMFWASGLKSTLCENEFQDDDTRAIVLKVLQNFTGQHLSCVGCCA